MTFDQFFSIWSLAHWSVSCLTKIVGPWTTDRRKIWTYRHLGEISWHAQLSSSPWRTRGNACQSICLRIQASLLKWLLLLLLGEALALKKIIKNSLLFIMMEKCHQEPTVLPVETVAVCKRQQICAGISCQSGCIYSMLFLQGVQRMNFLLCFLLSLLFCHGKVVYLLGCQDLDRMRPARQTLGVILDSL